MTPKISTGNASYVQQFTKDVQQFFSITFCQWELDHFVTILIKYTRPTSLALSAFRIVPATWSVSVQFDCLSAVVHTVIHHNYLFNLFKQEDEYHVDVLSKFFFFISFLCLSRASNLVSEAPIKYLLGKLAIINRISTFKNMQHKNMGYVEHEFLILSTMKR